MVIYGRGLPFEGSGQSVKLLTDSGSVSLSA